MERHVPKRDVASTIAVLLQTGRLRIARGLKESETLLRELLNFRVKISLSGHDTYEAWREQELYRTRFPGQLAALITPPPEGALDAQRPASDSRGAR